MAIQTSMSTQGGIWEMQPLGCETATAISRQSEATLATIAERSWLHQQSRERWAVIAIDSQLLPRHHSDVGSHESLWLC